MKPSEIFDKSLERTYHEHVTHTDESLERYVDAFLEGLKDDFTGGDFHDWEYGKLRIRPLLTATLTKVKNDTVAEILSMAPGAQDAKTGEVWYDPGVMEYMARIASLTRPSNT